MNADQRQLLGREIFIRHGNSKYTDEFPDITLQGEMMMARAAQQIQLWIGDCRSVKIHSSPKPRARGSAHIIKEIIGSEESVVIRPELVSFEIRNEECGMKIIKKCTSDNPRVEGKLYTEDPRYEDCSIFAAV